MVAATARSDPPEETRHADVRLSAVERAGYQRTALRLEYATIGWNLLEVAFALVAGVAAGSLALVAFGLDSTIELFASLVVVAHTRRAVDASSERSRRALRAIAGSFLVLGAWLVVSGFVSLLHLHRPDRSLAGIGFMGLTVIVMLGLASAKRTVGSRLGSGPFVANAGLTFLDGCVAGAVCLALLLDTALGWWWADAVAAGLVGAASLGEGIRQWRDTVPAAGAPGGGEGRVPRQ